MPDITTRRTTGASGCCARSPAAADQVQIMYGISGERLLTNGPCRGYPATRARSRSASATRHIRSCRLDVFGEVMDTQHQARRGGLQRDTAHGPAIARWWSSVARLAGAGRRYLGSPRRTPAFHLFQGDGLGRGRSRDQERRSVRPRRAARTMAQACASASRRRLRARLTIRRALCSVLRIDELDASLLLLPSVGFLPVTDPRIAGTIDAIEHELLGGRLRHALR